MHDIKETGARSTSGHAFKQAISPTDLVEPSPTVNVQSETPAAVALISLV